MLGACAPETEESAKGHHQSVVNTPIRTQNLEIPADFNFIGNQTIRISVMNPSAETERRYLNVCSDFSMENDEPQINYSSCQIRTSLGSAYSEYSLGVGSQEQRMVAQVWTISENARSKVFFWSLQEDGGDWHIQL